MKKAILLLSGGLDSSTLAYYLHKDYKLICLSFKYGQKHLKEIESASYIAAQLGCLHHVIDLSFMTPFYMSSSLINNKIDNPKADYTADNMLITVVPNRNSMFLTVAWSIACAEDAEIVAFAPHSADYCTYADCRPEYIAALNAALRLGTTDSRHTELSLYAPFMYYSKAKIVELGTKLAVPFSHTWSCYDGGTLHCGQCGTCRQRKQAFETANICDDTLYMIE